jgi:drug/metabolite transporter (DMT)-like permease
MATILALAAAVLYGGSDFLGGAAARRAHVLAVLTVAAPFGAVVMLAAAIAAGGPPTAAGAGWAVAGGAVGAAGLIVFYQGLAAGPMSVVAPLSALVATLLPVAVAVASGERRGPFVYAGALICLAAIVLVSMEGRAGNRPAQPRRALRALGYGAGAGMAFGIFFLCLASAGKSGVFWPVTAARVAGTTVMLSIAIARGIRPGPRLLSPRVLVTAAVAGAADAAANVCYVLATRDGMFGIAVILTSLYPGVTVLLARVVLGERMQMVQRLGLLLAGAGVILVTA